MEFAFVGVRTEAEWAAWRADSTNVETSGAGVRLARESTPTYVDPNVVVDDPTLVVVDVDQDDCGTLYLLAATGVIYVYEAGARGFRRLRCSSDSGRWGTPRALCVTDRDIYVAYRSGNVPDTTSTIRAISKAYLQTRWVVETAVVPSSDEGTTHTSPDETERRVSFGDIVSLVDVDGGSGRGGSGGSGVLALDRDPVPVDDPTSVDDTTPAPPTTDPSGVVVALSPDGTGRVVVDGLASPTDLTRDEAGNVSVLMGDQPGASVRKFVPDPETGDEEGTVTGSGPTERGYTEQTGDVGAPLPGSALTCMAVAGEDELVVGMASGPDGERALLRHRPESRRFERLLGFRQGCVRLRRGVSLDGDAVPGLFVVDDDRHVVSFVTQARRNRWNGQTERYGGQAVGRVDSGVDSTQWHRITFSTVHEGSGTQVRLRYLATDDAALRPRGDDVWTALDVLNPADAFLNDAVGRYLWIRLDLLGEEFTSPTVDTLRAYFPRQSYLRYLPAIYQTDPESRDFLERFLSMYERVFVDIEEEVDHLTRYADADGIPAASLGWLESWLGLVVDETWPETARRELLSEAAALFRARGTREGLRTLLEIYLRGITADSVTWNWEQRRQIAEVEAIAAAESLSQSVTDRIVERATRPVFFLEYGDLDCMSDEAMAETFEPFLNCPQCFLVLVRPSVTDEQLRTIQRLVVQNRPAHAVGRAVRLQSWVFLGGHTYLGVNSVLGDTDLVLGRSSLGRDTTLGSREPSAQLGVRAHLGDDRL
ncbi:phage tail protein domain-containing protein [Halogranum amylolyticum]|uniref:Phage tail protein domain-containing protein n=1 Tax=Halogranum amylolyticum TaxID=660520 RepID=A0A1H8WG83_9EURY|nr:phage tail protein [Halogranum amylolyticum]SEP26636.1 phage tail protein domain-containing protein [Halogranum amylolyticum]